MGRRKLEVDELTPTEALIGDDERDELVACFWTAYLGVEINSANVRWMGVLQAVARARFKKDGG